MKNTNTFSIVRLSMLLLLLVIFYSYMHNYTYRVLFIDKTFHGVPFTMYTNLDSLPTTINVSKAFDIVLNDYSKNLTNSYCRNIQLAIEINRNKNEFRSIIRFDFIDSSANVLTTYYFSPKHTKVWHIDDFIKPAKGFEHFQFCSIKKYEKVFETELENAFNFADSCDNHTNVTYTVTISFQKQITDSLMSNISIYLNEDVGGEMLCFQRDTLLR